MRVAAKSAITAVLGTAMAFLPSASQATGATFLPSAVVAWAAIRWRTLMTFISVSYATWCRSQ